MYFHHCLLLEFIFETDFELNRISLPYLLHPFSNSVSQLFQCGWKRTETLKSSQVQLLEDYHFSKVMLDYSVFLQQLSIVIWL